MVPQPPSTSKSIHALHWKIVKPNKQQLIPGYVKPNYPKSYARKLSRKT